VNLLVYSSLNVLMVVSVLSVTSDGRSDLLVHGGVVVTGLGPDGMLT